MGKKLMKLICEMWSPKYWSKHLRYWKKSFWSFEGKEFKDQFPQNEGFFSRHQRRRWNEISMFFKFEKIRDCRGDDKSVTKIYHTCFNDEKQQVAFSMNLLAGGYT